MKRIDLKIGPACNNHCLFCAQDKNRRLYADRDTDQIKDILKNDRKLCDEVVFTGGEVTIRQDVLDLIQYAKKLKFKVIQLQTNGRMLCYESFCDKIICAGATEFAISIHGHIAELHDYLTSSAGSFLQTVTAIKNLKKRYQSVLTNTVITKSNYRNLPQIAQFLTSLGVNQFQLAFVHPMGSAAENFYSIVPRISLAISHIKKALDIGIRAGIKVMTEAIPYCFMKGYENYIAEKIIPETKIHDLDKTFNSSTSARRNDSKIKGSLCKKCCCFKICEGPWKEYPDAFGWNEFLPIEDCSAS